MKRLARPPAPARFDRSDAERREQLVTWYTETRQVDRWNSREQNTKPVRDALHAMSSGRCAWCERALESGWHVEHFLPRQEFPWLCYCWENLLPACAGCNHAKRRWQLPDALKNRTLIDPVLADSMSGEPYDPVAVLSAVEDRLVEPSIDDPIKHLEFQPADCTWHPHTPAGRTTINKLFADRTYNERMQSISVLANEYVNGKISEPAVHAMLALNGHDTIFALLVDYWRSFTPAPAGAAPPTPRRPPN